MQELGTFIKKINGNLVTGFTRERQNKSGFDSELLSKLETEYHNYLK